MEQIGGLLKTTKPTFAAQGFCPRGSRHRSALTCVEETEATEKI